MTAGVLILWTGLPAGAVSARRASALLFHGCHDTASSRLEPAAFRDRGQWPAVYHELSHLGNAEDLDAPSPRWNEGLAMFLQGSLARELDGWSGEAVALERTAQRLRERCGSDEPCARVPMRRYGAESLTGYSYLVGRLMFAALFQAMGETAFDRAVRQHLQVHASAGTTTDDLVRSFVDVGGPVAQRILDEWLETTTWTTRLRQSVSLDELFASYRRSSGGGA